MLSSISDNLANRLALNVENHKYPTKEDQIEVYSYAIYSVISELSTAILLILLALFFNTFVSVLIIAFTFTTFRSIAGGYHFKTHLRCMMVSVLMFITTSLIIKYTLQYWSFECLWLILTICVIIGVYNIYYYIPRDTPNKPITEMSEILRFKKLSCQYLAIWVVIMIMIISMFELKIIVLSSCFGLLLELFSISKLGQLIYSRIDS